MHLRYFVLQYLLSYCSRMLSLFVKSEFSGEIDQAIRFNLNQILLMA